MARQLYVLDIPSNSQIQSSREARRNTISLSPVSPGESATSKAISLEAGEVLLRGFYRGEDADRMAAEVEELFDSEYAAIPFFDDTAEFDREGYYALRNVQTNPEIPQSQGELHRYDGALEPAGTKASHFRAIETQPNPLVNQVTTDSTQSFTRVAAPAAASNVHWYDAVSGAVFDAVPVDSTPVQTEFGGVDLFDPSAAFTTDRPTLTYDVDYADQGKTDVRVWDTNGNINRADSDGNVQWSRVFSSGHDFRGVPVVSNGAVRVFGRQTTHVDAEQWDDTNSVWSFASGPDAAPWELQAIDLRKLSPVGVDMRWRFRNTSTGQTHALAATLKRGRDVLHWENPDPGAQTTTPDPIRSMLNPIASRQTKIADPALGLIEKSKIEP